MSYIDVKNLSFGYDKKIKVLDDLSVSFDKGKVIALLGRNGSGKSTFLDCLLGTNEYEGTIEIDGINIKNLSSREFAKNISYIPQSVQINIDYTIRDFVSFGRNPYISFGTSPSQKDYEIVDNCMKKCGIFELSYKDINKVSGGERQLAFIARALSQETPIIIMDEPTAALDFGNQQKLFKIISTLANESKTIIFTTHNPNHLVNIKCDIFSVKDGKVKKIEKLDKKSVEEIYGEEFEWDGKSFLFKM